MGKKQKNLEKQGYVPQVVEMGTFDEDDDQDTQTSRSNKQEYEDVLPIADHLKKYNEMQEQNYKAIFYYLGIFCALIGAAFIFFGLFIVFLYPTPPNFVFIGDGITDGDRYRDKVPDNLSKYRLQEFQKKQLGSGYVLEIYQKLHLKNRQKTLKFFNRGNELDNISNIINNIQDIKALNPKVLTLMIGANDCLEYVKYLQENNDQQTSNDSKQNENENTNNLQIPVINNPEKDSQSNNNDNNRRILAKKKTRQQKINDQKQQQIEEIKQNQKDKENQLKALKTYIDPQTFHDSFKYLLEILEQELPNTYIVILEPFAFKGKITNKYPEFFEQFEQYQNTVRNLGRKGKKNTMIPLQSLINTKLDQIQNLTEFMSSDGIQPSFYLQDLIAEFWIQQTSSFVQKLL